MTTFPERKKVDATHLDDVISGQRQHRRDRREKEERRRRDYRNELVAVESNVCRRGCKTF